MQHQIENFKIKTTTKVKFYLSEWYVLSRKPELEILKLRTMVYKELYTMKGKKLKKKITTDGVDTTVKKNQLRKALLFSL